MTRICIAKQPKISSMVLILSLLHIIIVAKRVTIMLDDDLHTKLRKIQADKLKNATGSVSFSQVLNETLKKGLK